MKYWVSHHNECMYDLLAFLRFQLFNLRCIFGYFAHISFMSFCHVCTTIFGGHLLLFVFVYTFFGFLALCLSDVQFWKWTCKSCPWILPSPVITQSNSQSHLQISCNIINWDTAAVLTLYLKLSTGERNRVTSGYL